MLLATRKAVRPPVIVAYVAFPKLVSPGKKAKISWARLFASSPKYPFRKIAYYYELSVRVICFGSEVLSPEDEAEENLI